MKGANAEILGIFDHVAVVYVAVEPDSDLVHRETLLGSMMTFEDIARFLMMSGQ